MPYPNDSQIVAEIYRAAERFRTKPREEYLKSAATHLANKGLSVYQVRKILIEAAQTLDHFPSLAELEDLSSGFSTTTTVAIKHEDCDNCDSRGYELWYDDSVHTCIVACNKCNRGKVYATDKKYGCSDRDLAMQNGYFRRENRV